MIVVTLFRVVVGFMCQTEEIFYSTIRYTTFNSLIFKGKYYFSITVRNLRASWSSFSNIKKVALARGLKLAIIQLT